MLHLFGFYSGRYGWHTKGWMSPESNYAKEPPAPFLPLIKGSTDTTKPNNYQSIKAGNGISVGERIR